MIVSYTFVNFNFEWKKESRDVISRHMTMWEVGQLLRFHTQHIAHPPCLIPIRPVRLADRIDVIDADKPFILGEFDLAAEVVQVADQRGEDFAVAGLGLGRNEVDDMLGEVGVVFAIFGGGTVGAVGGVSGHYGGFCGYD